MQRQRIAALTQLGDNIFTSKSENNNIYNIQPQANGRSCFAGLPRQRRAQLQRLHRQGWISFLHTCKSTFVSIWNSFLFSAAVQWREASRHRGCGGQTRTSAEPICWQWVLLFVNCLLQNYLIDLQNLNKLCGRWRKTPWPKSPGTPLTSGIRFFFLKLLTWWMKWLHLNSCHRTTCRRWRLQRRQWEWSRARQYSKQKKEHQR